MQKVLLKIWYFERALSKNIKTLFFLSNPVPFNGQSYQKQKGSRTSDQLLFRLQNKFKKIPFFVMYYLTKFDGIMLSSFWVIPKITSANLCKPIPDIINYSLPFVLLNLESVGKEKITNIWISREQKKLFKWNKKHCYSF